MQDQTSGCLHQVSGKNPDVHIVYVKAYCSIYVKIALTMKDGGFADENVGWTCLPSTPEQSERF